MQLDEIQCPLSLFKIHCRLVSVQLRHPQGMWVAPLSSPEFLEMNDSEGVFPPRQLILNRRLVLHSLVTQDLLNGLGDTPGAKEVPAKDTNELDISRPPPRKNKSLDR